MNQPPDNDGPPPFVLTPELLAHMREHPDSDLSKLADEYIKLAMLFTEIGEDGRGRRGKLALTDAQRDEIVHYLEAVNERLERMLAAARLQKGLTSERVNS